MKTFNFFLFAILIFICIFLQTIFAQTTRYVNPDGLCGGNAPCYTTIQAAINASNPGDIINVAAGTYIEAVNITKPLTLRGATWNVDKNGYTVPVNYAWDPNVESIITHPNPSGGYLAIVDINNVDNVTFEGFVVQELGAIGNLNSSLVRAYANTQNITVTIKNNIIGPNTNTVSQNGTHGRMGLYLVNYPYSANFGIINSDISGNKIFGCEGNGDNIFIWSSYKAYGATGPASMAGTEIKNNEIYGANRNGIESAGGFSDLVIKDNTIYNNTRLPGSTLTPLLKYGNGIMMIRGSSDKTDNLGYGPVDVTIEGNQIYGNEHHGIYMGPNNSGITITGNSIYNNGWDGVIVDLDGQYWNPTFEAEPVPYNVYANYAGSQNVNVNNNQIYGNSNLPGFYGARVIGTPTNGFVMNASANWWGSTDPTIVSSKIAGVVDYTPIIMSGTDTDLGTPGFQPDMSMLTVHALGSQVGAIGRIQEGINLVSGSTVNVAAGTYKEQVIIDKGVTLIGDVANPDNVVIDGENKTTLPSDGQVRIYNPTGEVVFRGFKMINGGASSGGGNYYILTKGSYSNTIQNCKIVGHGSGLPPGEDYGIWAYTGSGDLIINDSYFSEMYHAILVEKITGATIIENNTFDNLYTPYYEPYSGDVGGRAIEAITYGGTNITSLQKVSGNTFTNFRSTGIIFSGGFSGSGVGKYTNVVIENNNFGFSTSSIVNNYGAINLRNVSSGGNSDPAGGVTADIHNNIINVPSSSGIQISGLNGTITCHDNSILGTPYGFKADAALTTVINTYGNWWGSNDPTTVATKVTSTVDYTPWLNAGTDTDLGTAGFQGDFSNLWVDDNSLQTGATGRIQEGVNLVSGSTVNVAAGTYNEALNITKSLTLNGAKAGLDARTRSTSSGESILDGTGFTTAQYSLIMIANGVSDVVIDGFEFSNILLTSTGGGVGNAISSYCNSSSTAGANNITIKNNYMHDLGYNGILVVSENTTGTSMIVQTGWLIQYNKITTYRYAGVELTNVTDSQVKDNDIAAPTSLFNDPGDAGVGIEIAARSRSKPVTAGTNIEVSGNTIMGSFPAGSRAAINLLSRAYVLSVSNATLSGVTVNGNNISGATNVRAAVLAVSESRNSRPATISSLAITNNILDGNNDAIEVQDYINGGSGPSTHSSITVTGNEIKNSTAIGMHILPSTSATGITVTSNKILTNALFGIKNEGTDTLDATYNDWGSVHGPLDAVGTVEMPGNPSTPVANMKNTLPSDKLGNAVSENVDYYKWQGKSNPNASGGGIWAGGYVNPSSNDIFAGFDPAADDGVDSRDSVAPPPPPSDYLYLYFLLAPGQPLENYSHDVKKEEASLATAAKHWDLKAITDHTSELVTIEFPIAGLPSGFKPTLYELATGKYRNLKDDPYYEYTSPASETPSSFLILIGDSTKPAVAVTAPNGGEFLVVGQPYNITWTSSDGTGVLRHYIYYSLTGTAPYTFIDSTNGNVYSYNWTPGAASSGASIKVIARDSVMNEESDISDHTFQILATNSIAYNAVAGWNLVSPAMQQVDMTPAGVFGDDYGATPYYTFKYSSTGGYSVPSALNMGQGYWLGSNSAQVIDAVGTPLSTANLGLTNGFNIIGNPFAVSMLKDSLKFTDGFDTKNMVEAAVAGWLSNVLYGYNGSGYIIEGTALGVWQGYWIPMLVGGITIEYTPTVVVPTPKITPIFVESTPTHWNIDLAAKLAINGEEYTDQVASFGVRADATEGFDALYDSPRPPRSPAQEYIEVSFPAGGENYPKGVGSSFARDYKTSDKTEWEFAVNTSREGTVTLAWDNSEIGRLSDEVKIELYDKAGHRSIDMKKINSYTFDQQGTSRRFTINKVDRVIPTAFELVQNYPNPFNPTTALKYGLPFDAKVIVEVYDIVGRKVATLVEGTQEAGYHEVMFDASQMASGLYLYRMTAIPDKGTPFTDSKKMMLVK